MVTRITRTGSLRSGYSQCSLLQCSDHHEKSLLVDEAGVSQALLPASTQNSSGFHLAHSGYTSFHRCTRQQGRHRAFLLQTKAFLCHLCKSSTPRTFRGGSFSGLENKIHHLSRALPSECNFFFKLTESAMLTLIPVRSLFRVVQLLTPNPTGAGVTNPFLTCKAIQLQDFKNSVSCFFHQ